MRTTTFIGVFALLLIGLVAASGLVSAFRGSLGQGFDPEKRDAIKSAIDSGDYETWKALQEDMLSEENFNSIVERHQSMEDKNARREAIKEAIDDGDYSAYKAAVGSLDGYPAGLEVMTEEDFNILVQVHKARVAGDFETANNLRSELGDGFAFGEGFGFGQNMGKRGNRHFGFGLSGGMKHPGMQDKVTG